LVKLPADCFAAECLAFIDPVTPETVSRALLERAGLAVSPGSIRLERRRRCWIGHLPDDLLVAIPEDAAGAARLFREGRLLELLAARVAVALPRVRPTDDVVGWQIRTRVPGAQIGGDGRERAFAARPQGMRAADELGRALAEIHGAVTVVAAAALGFATIHPLPDAALLCNRLDGKVPDQLVATTWRKLVERYAALEPPSSDVVLVHGDVWGGNLAVDLASGALNGLFDFDDAGLADRHTDFTYLPSFGLDFTERALSAYERFAGGGVSRQRTALYHAIAAFAALADTRGKGQAYLRRERLEWVSEVCRGPIAALALAG
jgi:aminoglycoside phosphotransferase (APT) family kinase protein